MNNTFDVFKVRFNNKELFHLAVNILENDEDLREMCDIGFSSMVFNFFTEQSRESFMHIIFSFQMWDKHCFKEEGCCIIL